MNDLLPPPRRSIPKGPRERMRAQLDTEITRPTTVNRRGRMARGFGVPAAAALAVAALTVGGYLLANNVDGTGTEASPAGHGSGDRNQTHVRQNGHQLSYATSTPPSTPMADPAKAYRTCIDLVAQPGPGEPSPRSLSGKLAIDNGGVTTVVVVDSSDAYTCNIKPDSAVSHGEPLASVVAPETFAVAANVSPDYTGELVWAGGKLPHGVTGLTFAFPDGHREQAVVQDGYWAMHYLAPEAFTEPGQPVTGTDPITVTLHGVGGRVTLTLPWGSLTCNQVSHGC